MESDLQIIEKSGQESVGNKHGHTKSGKWVKAKFRVNFSAEIIKSEIRSQRLYL